MFKYTINISSSIIRLAGVCSFHKFDAPHCEQFDTPVPFDLWTEAPHMLWKICKEFALSPAHTRLQR